MSDFHDTYAKDVWPPLPLLTPEPVRMIELTNGRDVETVRAGSNWQRILEKSGFRHVRQLEYDHVSQSDR